MFGAFLKWRDEELQFAACVSGKSRWVIWDCRDKLAGWSFHCWTYWHFWSEEKQQKQGYIGTTDVKFTLLQFFTTESTAEFSVITSRAEFQLTEQWTISLLALSLRAAVMTQFLLRDHKSSSSFTAFCCKLTAQPEYLHFSVWIRSLSADRLGKADCILSFFSSFLQGTAGFIVWVSLSPTVGEYTSPLWALWLHQQALLSGL